MPRKNILLWTLYDFANSIVTIVFFLYFSQWLVVDHSVSDFWYNMIFTGSSILLLLTAPILGSIADRDGRQHTYLNRITVMTFICYVITSLIALFLTESVLLAVIFFLLANYLYQFSFVFYNALLEKIAPPGKRGTISGLGQAGNWLGQIVGLLITLPFASGAIYLIGATGRAQNFLPATIIFFILTIPMIFFFKLPAREKPPEEKIHLAQEYRSQWKQFKELIKEPNLAYFLLAYFFFNDAILTAANNFPIYMEKVFAVPDTVKSLLLMSILLTSAMGALAAGWIADRIGLRKTLLTILGSWIVIFPTIGLTGNFTTFIIFTILMGTFYGATWTVTRAAFVTLCPKEKLNYGFSFYTLAERVSTFVGPLSWGVITTLLAGYGPTRYRIAIITMAGFVAIGMIILKKVKIKSPELLETHTTHEIQ